MPKFEVMRKIDAWVREVVVVDATNSKEALEVVRANEHQLKWQDAGTQMFDERRFVVLDEDGLEV